MMRIQKLKIIGLMTVFFILEISSSPIQSSQETEILHWIEESMEEGRIPGLALGIISDGEIVFQRGFGQANPDHPMNSETRINIGSFTKSFTSLAIVQLESQGLIDMDSPFCSYLPDRQFHESLQEISIYQLLTHSSGISSQDGMRFNRRLLAQHYSTWNFYEEVQTNPSMVGEFEYSNMNYNLLGLVIEETAGMPYYNYVEDNILSPMAMDSTGRTYHFENNRSNGYSLWFNTPRYIEEIQAYENYYPAMGYTSSLMDLMQYTKYLLNPEELAIPTVLSSQIIDILFTEGPRAEFVDIEGNYGYAWHHGYIDHNDVWVIQGGTRGTHSYLYLLPEEKLGIVVLTNMNAIFQTEITTEIGMGILAILMGNTPEEAKISKTYSILLTGLLLYLSAVILTIVVFFRSQKKRRIFITATVINLMVLSLSALMVFKGWQITLSTIAFAKPDLYSLTLLLIITISCTEILMLWQMVRSSKRSDEK